MNNSLAWLEFSTTKEQRNESKPEIHKTELAAQVFAVCSVCVSCTNFFIAKFFGNATILVNHYYLNFAWTQYGFDQGTLPIGTKKITEQIPVKPCELLILW